MGDYRVVYEIADQIRVVRVNRVRHRRKVYRREALKKGMEEKSCEFTEKGSDLYVKG